MSLDWGKLFDETHNIFHAIVSKVILQCRILQGFNICEHKIVRVWASILQGKQAMTQHKTTHFPTFHNGDMLVQFKYIGIQSTWNKEVKHNFVSKLCVFDHKQPNIEAPKGNNLKVPKVHSLINQSYSLGLITNVVMVCKG